MGVLLDGEVPDVPGVAAVVPQHRFLGGGGEQPVPGHANTLSDNTDISGEVTRRFLPGLKAGVSTPRSYDPSHRKPPRQERWPNATPPEGWPSHRDGDAYRGGEQADSRYGAQYGAERQGAYPATAGYRIQSGYGSAGGYGTADGYGDGRDRGYDWDADRAGGYPGRGYTGGINGYARATDDFAGAPSGYGSSRNGYAGTIDGYTGATDDFRRRNGRLRWRGPRLPPHRGRLRPGRR